MKRIFKAGCFGSIGIVVLLAILFACAPDGAPTVAPGLAVLAPTATTAAPAEETAASPAEPTQAPTPEPVVEPTPLPAPLVMTGRGDNISADFTASGPLVIVEFQHNGSGHFGVTLKNAADAAMVGLVANTIGAANGASMETLDAGAYFYDVSADGDWTITTKLAGHWERASGPAPYSFSGNGVAVPPIFTLADGRANVALTHNGTGHFGAILYNAQTGRMVDLLANAIGAADVTTAVRAAAGEYVIEVSADGDWTIRIEQ